LLSLNMKTLPRKFYSRNTIDVAISLLGCHFISRVDGRKLGGMIVETEVYRGQDDPACHAFGGRTPRNAIMYGDPGFLYVYFTYGNHFMLNVVTERHGFPAAVLLRALEPIYDIEEMARRRNTPDILNISSGPGKLARALGITTKHYGVDLTKPQIYIEGPSAQHHHILASPRIGVGDRGAEKLWRFFIADNPHVSKGSRLNREQCYELSAARKMSFTAENFK